MDRRFGWHMLWFKLLTAYVSGGQALEGVEVVLSVGVEVARHDLLWRNQRAPAISVLLGKGALSTAPSANIAQDLPAALGDRVSSKRSSWPQWWHSNSFIGLL
jgi:hypothetical protein